MTDVGLTSGEQFLRNAARRFFEGLYENPEMHLEEELHRDLSWTPALWFTIHEQIRIFVEPSETSPYPRILELKNGDVRRFPQPIAIYAACPEEILHAPGQRGEIKRLEADGYGLVTVDADGNANRVISAIPLIHIIPSSEFKQEIKGLPKKLRQRISEAFEDYCSKPVNGVKSLSEVIEGMVEQAGKDAVKKQYLQQKNVGGSIADLLDALHNLPQCNNVRAQIGGVRSFVAEYRNLSHHWPKDAKRAHKKFSVCRHAFLDGIKRIHQFRTAMKVVGFSGNLPRA